MSFAVHLSRIKFTNISMGRKEFKMFISTVGTPTKVFSSKTPTRKSIEFSYARINLLKLSQDNNRNDIK